MERKGSVLSKLKPGVYVHHWILNFVTGTTTISWQICPAEFTCIKKRASIGQHSLCTLSFFVSLFYIYISALPLPELSKATKDDLLQGDKSRRVWLQLIEESKNYYMKYCPQIDENPYGAYKIIGQKMLAAYPSIERDGKHKWVRIFRYTYTIVSLRIDWS